MISLDLRNDEVAVITLRSPEKLNALNTTMVLEVSDALTRLTHNPKIRALVITGEGRGFCSGADITQFAGEKVDKDALMPRSDMGALWNPIMTQLHELPKAVVIAVNGVAAGAGCGLAVSGDITVMERKASFVLTFVPKIGLMPDLGVTWHFPRRMGRGAALPHALLGAPITAEKAMQTGLIYEVCDGPEATLQRGIELAKTLAAGSLPAILAVRNAFDEAPRNSYADQLGLERREQAKMFANKESQRVGAAHRARHGKKKPAAAPASRL